MEVVQSSDAQQNSGTAFIYDGESNGFENKKQVNLTGGGVDSFLLKVDGMDKQSQGQGIVDELPMSEGHQSGASYSDCQLESQRLSCDSYDFEGDDLNVQNYCAEPCATSENSHFTVENIESEPGSHKGGDWSPLQPKWLENDESMALWVKWRGKWQAGIRCAKADWPLSTLKAKPTHDRKKYFVVFFPHTRNYSWADIQLVQSINKFPEPIAYRTHKIGLEMVKDLSIARRFIMQKLAVGMLNIVDQFHTEALKETAHDVLVWKEFAMEASRCSGYPDLGRMLLKLQSVILQRYLNSDWLQNSFQSWVQRCQTTHSAETVELLREELFASILWNEVNSLRDAPVQPTLSSEWKTWKHEVMKWFSTSHLVSNSGHIEQRTCDNPSPMSLQVRRKRPKLEVRRAEPYGTQVETSNPLQNMVVEIDSELNTQDSMIASTQALELSKVEDPRKGAASIESPCSVADRWDDIVVEAGNTELIQTKDVETSPVIEVLTKESGSKSRQCIAFIQSKGRQCVRWANDGDVYCCVHLGSRFTCSSAKTEASPPVPSPMCEGTTVLGTRCKHRALLGFSFCKKHRSRTDAQNALNSPANILKRKHEDIITRSDSMLCKDTVVVGEVESPLLVDAVSVLDDDAVNGRSSLIKKFEHFSQDNNGNKMLHCIGSSPLDSSGPCHEIPKRYSLYCDKHIPSWLKHARNGKSRIISKELFLDILRECSSLEQKLNLHQACELFHKLFKSILSLRNQVPMDDQLQWALSEASKSYCVGKLLLKLVCTEKERLTRMWGFRTHEDVHVSSSMMEGSGVLPLAIGSSYKDEKSIRCKICSEEFLDDQELGNHWMENHKKEAQWLFRGHACAICLDSFTNKKGLETHMQERHHVQFVEQCMLLQCIPCRSHFGNTEELWLHVFSVHSADLRLSNASQQPKLSISQQKDNSLQKLELDNAASVENNSQNSGGIRKFICRFCGLKFDLLPDLGHHHQAAHMGLNLSFSSHFSKNGIRYHASRLKSGRLSHPRFKKGLGAATYRMRNRASVNTKKRTQATKSLGYGDLSVQPHAPEAGTLGRLTGSQCSAVAKSLFSEVQKTKARPNNFDILAIARSTCCKVSLKASLEGKYGILPERLYLKAAKLCSEHNIQVEWHQEGFICPRGCKSFKDLGLLSPLMPLPNGHVRKELTYSSDHVNNEWEMDEYHYVTGLHDLRGGPRRKATVLCNDISFGKEPIPIPCVVYNDFLDSLQVSRADYYDKIFENVMPWESFNYVTKPILDQSYGPDIESLHLGCACPCTMCHPDTCDHVYLFDNDHEDAKDIYGKPMRGRFPYDDKGRIILEEGYLVYECNHMCSCNKTCPNRVLQNGIRVKLEVFKTENEGWALRAGEPILRGTFICEYIGEVLDEQEAEKQHDRYCREGCRYMYNSDAHANDMSRLIQEQSQYVIDATRYGNVSRFINHSCLPNLVNYQVLVDSMDSKRSHIGLFASQDIAFGEELTYNYRYKLPPGEGYPYHCGASKCHGQLY